MNDFLSTEEKLKRVRGQFPLWVAVLIKSVVERYGDEGRRLIMDALYNQGLIQGQRAFAEEKKVKSEWNVEDIIERAIVLTSVMGFIPDKVEVKELSPTRGVLRFHYCPLAERWKIVQAPADMCELWGSYAHGLYRAFNPKFNFRVSNSMYHGNSYCEELWEIEE